jgi:phosphopantetheinyl transferase (holo-ACP synthase)
MPSVPLSSVPLATCPPVPGFGQPDPTSTGGQAASGTQADRPAPNHGGSAAGSAISFNLSHSGDWGLLGVGLQQYIGVDIEQERDLPDLTELARTVLTPAEAAVLEQREPQRRAGCFLAMWTRKEAAVKAVGTGIGSPLETIEIEPADPAAADEFTVAAGIEDMPPLFGLSFRPASDYFGAVVCEGGRPHIVWHDWPVQKLEVRD